MEKQSSKFGQTNMHAVTKSILASLGANSLHPAPPFSRDAKSTNSRHQKHLKADAAINASAGHHFQNSLEFCQHPPAPEEKRKDFEIGWRNAFCTTAALSL